MKRQKDEPHISLKPCNFKGCKEQGQYKAPQSPQKLREYYWFCLEHIRLYNKSWDYYKNMTPHAIHMSRLFDASWERQTQPFHGYKRQNTRKGQESFNHFIFHKKRKPQSPEETQALALFHLTPPVHMYTLKRRYLELVKAFHPDVGLLKEDDMIKKINVAYALLKKIAIDS